MRRGDVLLIAAVTLVAYRNALDNEFVWDDVLLIVENPAIKDPGRALSLLFRDLFPAGVLSNYYRPLQAITYAADYQVWGLDPFGFHLVNVLLHAATATLLYGLGTQWLGDRRGALFAALLYAVHPLHTEAVTYVAGRADPLSAALLLGAILLSIRARRRDAPLAMLLSALVFLLALLARESAAIGIVLLLLIHRTLFGGERTPRRPLVRYGLTLYAGALLGYAALRAQAVGFGAPGGAVADVGIVARLATMVKVIVGYLTLLVVPVGQHMERRVEVVSSPLDPLFLGSLALLIAAAVVVIRRRHAAPPLALGAAWFVIAILPVCQIVPLSTFMAEHWLYVPSMGLFLAAGTGLSALWQRGWPQPVATALVIALAAYGGATMERNTAWSDSLSIHRATLRQSPSSARSWSNLGHAHQEAGDLVEAERAYRRAIEQATALGPASGIDLADPYNNLASVHREQGRPKDALRELEHALAINPQNAAAHNNLGLTLNALGRPDEARAAFEQALRLDPELAAAHSNLGNHHFRRGELAAAERRYRLATRLDPEYAEAWNNLGSVRFRQGHPEEAIRAYTKALELDPALEEARRNREIAMEAVEKKPAVRRQKSE